MTGLPMAARPDIITFTIAIIMSSMNVLTIRLLFAVCDGMNVITISLLFAVCDGCFSGNMSVERGLEFPYEWRATSITVQTSVIVTTYGDWKKGIHTIRNRNDCL